MVISINTGHLAFYLLFGVIDIDSMNSLDKFISTAHLCISDSLPVAYQSKRVEITIKQGTLETYPVI